MNNNVNHLNKSLLVFDMKDDNCNYCNVVGTEVASKKIGCIVIWKFYSNLNHITQNMHPRTLKTRRMYD
jgi:hypothetical protein